MADTIREQIITAYLDRLEDWTTTKGFNSSCGENVFRSAKNVDPETLPACVLHPGLESVTQQYGMNVCEVVFRLEALSEIEDVNPSVIQEMLLGDAIKIMTDPTVEITALADSIIYTSGGPATLPVEEDTIVAVSADFIVKYNTLTGNPYSQ